jgi:hypothetical protein
MILVPVPKNGISSRSVGIRRTVMGVTPTPVYDSPPSPANHRTQTLTLLRPDSSHGLPRSPTRMRFFFPSLILTKNTGEGTRPRSYRLRRYSTVKPSTCPYTAVKNCAANRGPRSPKDRFAYSSWADRNDTTQACACQSSAPIGARLITRSRDHRQTGSTCWRAREYRGAKA